MLYFFQFFIDTHSLYKWYVVDVELKFPMKHFL